MTFFKLDDFSRGAIPALKRVQVAKSQALSPAAPTALRPSAPKPTTAPRSLPPPDDDGFALDMDDGDDEFECL